jgi:transcriptional regulator with XRE-family HTH domain
MKARLRRTKESGGEKPVATPRRASREAHIGERLKAIREMYGFSQRTLARRADVTNGIISLIEQNRSSPSVATLKKILDGFPMSLAEFFAVGQRAQEQIFFNASELAEIGGGLESYLQVGSSLRGRAMQILYEHLQPGADSGPEMLRHQSEEGGVVVRGRLELTVGTERRVLGPGDAYYFDSRTPHRFRNLGEEVCEIVSACTPPSF